MGYLAECLDSLIPTPADLTDQDFDNRQTAIGVLAHYLVLMIQANTKQPEK